MHQYQPNDGYRERYYNNEEGSPRNDKHYRDHSNLPDDVYGKMDRHQNRKHSDIYHYGKNTPVQLMPVMMMTPEMYMQKYSSKPSYHRATRSIVPYFHNVQNDLNIAKSEMIRTSPIKKERVLSPRSPKTKKQYPLKTHSSLLHTSKPVNMIVKDIGLKKRSTRDIKNYIGNKTEKDHDEKYMSNEILNETKKADELLDQDSFDVKLIKDKNKLFQSLTNKLTNLAKVYLKESSKDKDDNGEPMESVKEKIGVTEISNNGSKIIIFNTVNDLKNSAEEDENKGSEKIDKFKNMDNSENIIKNNEENEKKPKNNTNTSSAVIPTLQPRQGTFTYVVDQMKRIINFIVSNLIPLQ